MRRPLRSNIRKPRHEVTQENIAFQFESLADEVPLRLTPRDDISKMGVKAYFSQSPMLLSPGVWSVYGLMGITSNNNIHIIGSGYHTIFRCGIRNTDGVLSITGNDVVIENVHFARTVNSATPDVGSLVSVTGQRVTIRNCWFDASNALNAITANVADNLTIESCVIDGGRGDIVYVLDSDNTMVKGNRVVPVAGWDSVSYKAIFFASTNAAVVAERCNDGIIVGNHVGSGSRIRHNNTGAHMLAGNNTSAILVGY